MSDKNRKYGAAYLILGHGAEGEGMCKVPPGCAVVVDAHAGEVIVDNTYLDGLSKRVKQYFNKENEAKLLNPEDNYKSLLENISTGSLAIYKEGDMCPNFIYTLVSYTLKEPITKTTEYGNISLPERVLLGSSGIYKNPFQFEYKFEAYDKSTHATKLSEFFEGSLYPTVDDILELGEFHNKLFPEKTIKRQNIIDAVKRLFKDATQNIEQKMLELASDIHALLEENIQKKLQTLQKYTEHIKFLAIRQSDLFEMVEKGTFEPGVFYNLICRQVSSLTLNNSVKNAKKYNIKNIYKVLNEDTQKLRLFNPILLSRIRETEKHRKPYIKQAYTNSNNTINHTREINFLKDSIKGAEDIASKHNSPLIKSLLQEQIKKTINKLNKMRSNKNRKEFMERASQNKTLRWKRGKNGSWSLNTNPSLPLQATRRQREKAGLMKYGTFNMPAQPTRRQRHYGTF